MPVVLEVRPGVYRKNAQVAHVYGVKPKAARYREGMPPEERDSFANLLLLCLAHHQEVDSDEHRYPPELLKEWKKQHEGGNNPVLNNLRVTNLDALGELLAELAEPPLQRLEAVTKRLEETGVANAETVRELKQIISTMATMDGDVSAQSARALAYAAEVFSGAGSMRALGRPRMPRKYSRIVASIGVPRRLHTLQPFCRM